MASTQGLFTSSLPELYEQFLVEPLFRPFAQDLLDRVRPAAGDRLLDVACGTGIVARLAREALGNRGRIVGVDASPGMIGVANAVAPAMDWRVGDAARLPVGDNETFEVVTCHQGLQFFSDRLAALRDMWRVLAPGGRIAIATWRPVEEVPLMRDLQQAAERHLGPIVDQRHSAGDADALRRLLADAGFGAIRVEVVTHTVRMTDVLARLNTMALVGMSVAAKTKGEEERTEIVAAITAESLDVMERYRDGSDFAFELGSNIATAHQA